MKKTCLLLCMVLVLSIFTFAVSAAENIQKSPTKEVKVVTILDANGNELKYSDISISNDTSTLTPEALEQFEEAKEQIQSAASVENFIEEVGLKEELKEVFADDNVAIVNFFDISASPAILEALKYGPVTIEFTVSGLKEGDKVAALHNISGTNEWELLPGEVDGDIVKVKFTSFSPVAIVATADEVAPVDGETNNNIFIYAGIGVVALAGVVVLLVQKKKVK